MRILYIINSLSSGGAEKLVSDLSNYCVKENHDVHIVSIFGDETAFYLNPKVNVKLLKYNFGFFGFFKSFFRIFLIVYKLKPQIIHSHLLISNLIVRVISIFFNKPVIINSAHSISENYSFVFFLYRVTHPLVDLFSNVSNLATNSFIKKTGLNKTDIVTIYNGVDFDKFKRETSFYKNRTNKLNIIAIGSLNNRYKDFTTLIKAFKLIKEKIPYANLKLVGDGPDKIKLEKLCESLYVDKTIFLGFRHDIDRLLKESDIFISSSKIESFGLSIAEAMSSSVLVVATKSDGAMEVVKNKDILVSIGDYKGIFEKVLYLHNLTFQEKKKIVNRSRKRILNNFGLKQMTNKWIYHYETLLNKKIK